MNLKRLMPGPNPQGLPPVLTPRLIPTRTSHLRRLAHSRHIVLGTLPLGAGTGFLVALALKGLGSFEPIVLRAGGETRLAILLPAIGLFLTTAWLTLTGRSCWPGKRPDALGTSGPRLEKNRSAKPWTSRTCQGNV
jgi:hypothetical protein